MATITQVFTPRDAIFAATNPATVRIVSGANFPVESLAFDAATAESVFFAFLAAGYGSGNLTIRIYWYADTAGSGNVVWNAELAAITPDTDTTDIEVKGLATANTVTDSHLGTVNQRLHSAVITLTNLDSIAARDWCMLEITRDAANGSDTMTGDALVAMVVVEYSDT